MLAVFYFTLAATLSFSAVFSDGRTTTGPPSLVSLCNLAHGGLVPGAIVSALASGLVFYNYDTLFDDATRGITDVASTFGICALMVVDLVVNRQPYYASFHGILGCEQRTRKWCQHATSSTLTRHARRTTLPTVSHALACYAAHPRA